MSGISGISDYSAYGNFASGKKINTAADGAAELGIIQEQTKQINGYDAGSRNIESGKDALNISDAALGNVTDYLQRMRELAIQAKSGIMSDSDKGAIQSEIDQLKQGCFLQALFGQSCKTFLDIIASPNWTKLQSLDWQLSCQPHSHCRPYLVVTA